MTSDLKGATGSLLSVRSVVTLADEPPVAPMFYHPPLISGVTYHQSGGFARPDAIPALMPKTVRRSGRESNDVPGWPPSPGLRASRLDVERSVIGRRKEGWNRTASESIPNPQSVFKKPSAISQRLATANTHNKTGVSPFSWQCVAWHQPIFRLTADS